MPKPPIAETNNCYAVCVGINQYCSSAQVRDLHCAEKDAEALYDLLLRKGFAKDNCLLILGTEATQETVYDALKTFVLTKPRSDDLIIFYFAGHGLPISISNDEEDADLQSDVFLVTSNFDHQRIEGERGAWLEYPLRLENLRTDFFERTRSKKVLFILDSCHSGDIYGPSYRGEQLAHHYIEQAFAKKSAGRVVLSSCMPQQKAREDKKLGHGLFTYHLLEALEGRTPHAVERDGWLTVGSLFSYLSKKLPIDQRPVKSGVEHSNFQLLYYPEYVERSMFSANQGERDEQKDSDKEHRLRAMLADHLGFMRDRLESFVGRQAELMEIRQRIAEKLLTGGYVTITGQAGQGKSCIIAKLVEEYGPDNVSFHFIPFNPGPDHQVGLLRNLMARLILKYNLPEIYVASESRPALRDYFPKVLGELVTKGGQEVIFIDGLDQLEEEQTGARDLSFLPNNPPPGVVFVLGTRPNDTLRPLELLKPRHEYQLPNLSRDDFDLILGHRQVHLSKGLTDRFYEAMQENALYLDLVAKELAETGPSSQVGVIKRVADNPDNIFSLSIDRFKRQERQWRTVLKPILGLLLAASEPLGIRHIRQILAVEDDEIRDGLRRLGGLVAEDGQGLRYLFHLKLQDYLRQDENRPNKEYVFASDEEIQWHRKLTCWCEQNGLENIWQDVKWDADEQGRRVYARRHYITHLYRSKAWEPLCKVLDEGNYGRAKVRYDPSTRSYAQDLDLGRQMAAQNVWTMEESLVWLPYLWRYTLLRCSLTSRADSYTPEAFEALMLLKQEQAAVDLAELLTKPDYKVNVLRQIAKHLAEQQGREQECFQLLIRSFELVKSIEDSFIRVDILRKLGLELAKIQQSGQARVVWKQAELEARIIEHPYDRTAAMRELAITLIQAQQWEQAETVVRMIDDSNIRVEVLRELAITLIQAQQWEQAELTAYMIKENWARATRVEVLRELFTALIQAQQWKQAETVARTIEDDLAGATRVEMLRELFTALIQAQQWEQAEMVARLIGENKFGAEVLRELIAALIQAQQWKQAETVVHMIKGTEEKAQALQRLGIALAKAQHWELAEKVWNEIEEMARTIKGNRAKVEALQELGIALAKAQHWGRAEKVWNEIEEMVHKVKEDSERAEALRELSIALAEAHQWERAESLWTEAEATEEADMIGEDWDRVEALRELGTVLIEAQQWERAQSVIHVIEEDWVRAQALQELAMALTEAQQSEQAEAIWEEAEEVARSILHLEERMEGLRELSIAMIQVQQWEHAEAVIHMIEDEGGDSSEGLRKLSMVLTEAQQWERAEAVVHRIEERGEKAEGLHELAIALTEVQQWERAEAVARKIEESEERAEALLELACNSGQTDKV